VQVQDIKKASGDGSDVGSIKNIDINILPQSQKLAEDFLRACFGKIPKGFLTIWTLEDKVSRYFELPGGIDAAARYAMEQSETKNVYFGTGARRENLGKYKRGDNADVCYIYGVWLDVDIKGGDHAEPNLPDEQKAEMLLRLFPLEPSSIVHSGGGWHVYYLLDKPVRILNEKEMQDAGRMVSRCQNAFIQLARLEGFALDNTSDLARVLRVPGTFNRKSDPKPVTMPVFKPEVRYSLAELLEAIQKVEATLPAPVPYERRGKQEYEGDLPDADADKIVKECQAVRGYLAHKDSAVRDEWLAMLTIAAFCEDGNNLVHEWSMGHPGYDEQKVDGQYHNIRKTMSPRTCNSINVEFGACAGCPHFGKINSPIALGMRKKEMTKKKTKEKPRIFNRTDLEEEPVQSASDWQEQLEKTDKGKNYSNAFNALWILRNDKKLKGKFAFNLLSQRAEIVGEVPWERTGSDKIITDHDDSCLRNYLSVYYDIKSKDIIYDSLNQIVMDHKYHPIQDYLNSVRGIWDGKSRLDTLLIDFFDAEDTELNRWQTRLALVGAVKRIFQPGCKFDYVLTLKGEQGVGKSTFLQKLAVMEEWFSDSLDDIRGKDAKEQIQGKWIIELGEMAAVGKADQKRTKQFISSEYDEFRAAYGRRTARYPRQCIFVASTNDELPLKDDTGGRRWWIVDVKSRWFDKDISLEIDQIWAEAVCIYDLMEQDGKPLKLPNHLENEVRRVQSDNTDKGLYAAEIEFALERGYIEKFGEHGCKFKVRIDKTCAFHVWEEILGRYKHDLTKPAAREINAVLKNLEGWECIGRRQFGSYGKQTVYQRKDI